MLQGTLDTLDVTDLLTIVWRKNLSGTLRIRSSHVSTLFWTEGGGITGLDSPDVRGRDLRARCEEAIARLFEARHGTFELQVLDAQQILDSKPFEQPALAVRALLLGAQRRQAEVRELRALLPDGNTRFHLADAIPAQVTLTGEQWRVVQAVDGHRSARSLARQLDLDERDLAVLLKQLVEAGAVVADPGVPDGGADGDGRATTTIVIRSASLPLLSLDPPARDTSRRRRSRRRNGETTAGDVPATAG